LRVYEKRLLRRIFVPKIDEVTRGWSKLNNEELHDLYYSPNLIRMSKLKKMGWAGQVARIERKGVHTGYSCESQTERAH
jgi:hypothetical protein